MVRLMKQYLQLPIKWCPLHMMQPCMQEILVTTAVHVVQLLAGAQTTDSHELDSMADLSPPLVPSLVRSLIPTDAASRVLSVWRDLGSWGSGFGIRD